MLAAVKPSTMAMTLMRISLATDVNDGETSIECLMFRGEKATACLTPTSERSILQNIQLASKQYLFRADRDAKKTKAYWVSFH